MANSVITARIDPGLSQRLDAMADDLQRSRSWLVARAIERFVSEEAELLAAIREGEADLAAGRVHTQAAVETMFGVSRIQRDAA